MLKLNLDKLFTDLRGNNLNERMNIVLANALASATFGNPAQMVNWAKELVSKGEILVNDEDLEFLKAFITNHLQIMNIGKAQLLDEIEFASIKAAKPKREVILE